MRVDGASRIVLMGENGNGKTTLVNVLMGLLQVRGSEQSRQQLMGPSERTDIRPIRLTAVHCDAVITSMISENLDVADQRDR